jgi:CheY-like chemotaxis protein/K+-sensing histidine kinase KdpD
LQSAQVTSSIVQAEVAASASAQTDADDGAGAGRQARSVSEVLTRVSELLAQGTDIGAQLRDVARALVPAYASACVIERVDTAAALREVLCTQHESAALDADLRTWACKPAWLARVIAEVMDGGKPRLLDLEDEADVLTLRGSRADVASARALGFDSVIVVPMIARRRLFGVLTCASRAARPYAQSHVDAFADLAHRLALALDNAELRSAALSARREQDELLAALSSELQVPLAALGNAAEQALGRTVDASETALAQMFAHETRRMQAQLSELIELSQLRAGQPNLRVQDVELEPLLRRVVEQACTADARSRLTLQVDANVAGLRVRADPERLTQALQVLLNAALLRTPNAGTLEACVSRVDEDLKVTLSGSSTKWSAQDMGGLSELTSLDYDSSVPNSARPTFGLRLAHALIDMQGGRLWAAGADGAARRRTSSPVLHLSLPLSAAHARDDTERPSPETVILLVDSDLAFRRELQEILCERGYNVETADNGLQAWQYLLGHSPPALILFDLVLPAMDGWELHAAIKSHAALQLVPTVVVSGLDRYRIEASLPDAHGYIEKPIRSAQLFEVVQRHVVGPARPRTLSVRPSSCF